MAEATDALAPVDHSPSGFGRLFGAISRHSYYRTYWIGNQASTLVIQMQFVAIGFLAFDLTQSATILGIVSLAFGLPMLLLSPFGGVLADRYPKRDIVLVVQLVLCLNAAVIGTLVTLNLVQWWHLAIVALVQGSCFAINMPARQSWIPSLVPAGDLPNAIALNNAGLNASRIVGPALAGLLIAIPAVGATGVFYLAIPAAAWVFYSLLRIPIRGDAEPGKRSAMHREMVEGLRYIWHSETLAPLFTLALVTLLLGLSYQQLMPVFALGVFQGGSEELGLMMTAVGVGALAGSLSMAYFSRSKQKGRIQAFAGAGLGLGLVLFGVVSGLKLFDLALVMLFFVGMASDFYLTINNTLIMLHTDRPLYGRVMAVYMMTWSLSPLAAAPFGALMDRFGGPLMMIIIGGILVVFVVAMTTLNPSYRRIN